MTVLVQNSVTACYVNLAPEGWLLVCQNLCKVMLCQSGLQ